MNNSPHDNCPHFRSAFSAWADGEMVLGQSEKGHLAQCEACREYVAFIHSAKSLLTMGRPSAQPLPIQPQAVVQKNGSWVTACAAVILGFVSVAPVVGLLKRTAPPKQNLAEALHALRQAPKHRPASDQLAESAPVRAIQAFSKGR